MFPTSDISRAALVCGLVFSVNAASAQNADLEALAQSMASAGADASAVDPADMSGTSAAIRDMIENRIRAILASRGTDPMGSDEALDIDEIDAMNRRAARAEARLELERTEIELIKSEIEGLMALYTTIGEFEAQTQARNGGGQMSSNIDRSRPQMSQDMPSAPAMAPHTDPEKATPTVLYIFGSGGMMRAGVTFANGRLETVEPGDRIAGGFLVDTITADAVTLRNVDTDATTTLMPAPDSDSGMSDAQQTSSSGSGNGGPMPGGQVIDLSAPGFQGGVIPF